MNRTILLFGVFFGISAVLLGAFGAHGLKELISESSLDSYKTAVTYQMYHALLLLWLGSTSKIAEPGKKWIFWCLLLGVILFSFSIYLLATISLHSINLEGIAFLTPLGGAFLITAWFLLGYRIFKYFN
ncbi:MAG: DUF423 domain-containing protein [Flavobacteriaceae bacterium]|nr:DUF423 domain-containing protein [Muriicola sp.]NNC60924.1 DUF423 domain-containing protein [Eudoraea sp.]NNK21469.1 DUF423 domain-containing protein [Flavobacteriaceae bacterium]NNL40502.1 DUF423 domain-containing protein [Flavobacteriaceae bacterium]